MTNLQSLISNLYSEDMMMQKMLLMVVLLLLVACAPPLADESAAVLATPGGQLGGETAVNEANNGNGAAESVPLMDMLSGDPDLVLFLAALNSTGVAANLQSGGPYTIFVPSNEAFTRLEMATTEIDTAVLRQTIEHHVTFGRIPAAELAGTADSLAGDALTFAQEGEEVLVDGYAAVTQGDVPVAEGVVHVVDALLLPTAPPSGVPSVWELLLSDGRFSRMTTLMQGETTMYQLHFNDAADAFIVPTDEAFTGLSAARWERLLSDADVRRVFLGYYTITQDGWPRGTPLTVADMLELGEAQSSLGNWMGHPIWQVTTGDEGTVRLDGATLLEGDLSARNGVVHVIDGVVWPEAIEAE